MGSVAMSGSSSNTLASGPSVGPKDVPTIDFASSRSTWLKSGQPFETIWLNTQFIVSNQQHVTSTNQSKVRSGFAAICTYTQQLFRMMAMFVDMRKSAVLWNLFRGSAASSSAAVNWCELCETPVQITLLQVLRKTPLCVHLWTLSCDNSCCYPSSFLESWHSLHFMSCAFLRRRHVCIPTPRGPRISVSV